MPPSQPRPRQGARPARRRTTVAGPALCRLPARERGCLCFSPGTVEPTDEAREAGSTAQHAAQLELYGEGPPAGRRCPPACRCQCHAPHERDLRAARGLLHVLGPRPRSPPGVASAVRRPVLVLDRIRRAVQCSSVRPARRAGLGRTQAAAAREATIREGTAVPGALH
jgi:hypothetical protein